MGHKIIEQIICTFFILLLLMTGTVSALPSSYRVSNAKIQKTAPILLFAQSTTESSDESPKRENQNNNEGKKDDDIKDIKSDLPDFKKEEKEPPVYN